MTDDVKELVEAFEGLLSSVDQLFPTDGPVKARARAALEALSRDRAGEVQDTWFTDTSLPVMAMSGDAEDSRVLKLHFRRPVTDQDRKDMTDAMNALLRDRAGEQKVVALPPIEADGPREYIPLPGGWEVQTKGTGSSYRLLDTKSGDRHAILCNEASFVLDFFTRFAKEVRTAYLASPAPDEVRRMALEEAADYLKERVEANKGLPCSLPLSEAEAAIRSLASAPPAEDPKDAADSLCSDCPPIGYPTDETRCAPCPRRAALRASSEKEPKT